MRMKFKINDAAYFLNFSWVDEMSIFTNLQKTYGAYFGGLSHSNTNNCPFDFRFKQWNSILKCYTTTKQYDLDSSFFEVLFSKEYSVLNTKYTQSQEVRTKVIYYFEVIYYLTFFVTHLYEEFSEYLKEFDAEHFEVAYAETTKKYYVRVTKGASTAINYNLSSDSVTYRKISYSKYDNVDIVPVMINVHTSDDHIAKTYAYMSYKGESNEHIIENMIKIATEFGCTDELFYLTSDNIKFKRLNIENSHFYDFLKEDKKKFNIKNCR